MHDILSLLSALPEVEPSDREAAWFSAANYYPIYQQLGAMVRPRHILEMGTRLGYSLIALLDGAETARMVTWVDDESALPGSNIRAELNLVSYLDQYYPTIVDYACYRDHDALEDCTAADIDLIHFDSDHSYEGTFAELNRLYRLFPEAIVLVDDFSASTEIQGAVLEFASVRQVPLVPLATHQGLAVLNFRSDLRSLVCQFR